jgi:dihydroflavonol-4-reductase
MDGAVLITGISGFIGKHCALALLRRGERVRGTVRSLARAEEVRATLGRHVAVEDRLAFVAADLDRDEGWDAALDGCRFVLHVASPFPLEQPGDPEALIRPAREGTLRVLKAAAKAGVARTVLTSSTASVMYVPPKPGRAPLTEEDWSDLAFPRIQPYARSKMLAERAAWDFMARDKPAMELAVINPGFVLGPALDGDLSTSIAVIQLMLRGKYPAVPRLHFPTVDVRDVADLHVAALSAPKAAGQRFLCAERSLWLIEIARAIRAAVPEATRMPTRQLPDFLVRALALFDPRLRAIAPELGRERPISNAKATALLDFRFRPALEAAIASARSLIELRLG